MRSGWYVHGHIHSTHIVHEIAHDVAHGIDTTDVHHVHGGRGSRRHGSAHFVVGFHAHTHTSTHIHSHADVHGILAYLLTMLLSRPSSRRQGTLPLSVGELWGHGSLSLLLLRARRRYTQSRRHIGVHTHRTLGSWRLALLAVDIANVVIT